MKESRIYVEGGGSEEELKRRCKAGFTDLLKNAGFQGRMPRIIACGSRNDTFDKFRTAHLSGDYDFVALLVDSEDPVANGEQTWAHLLQRKEDEWIRPKNATDEQVFLMTTCMETWLVADRAGLQQHYGSKLQASALPALLNLETRHRHDIQDALERATVRCTNTYQKNKRAFTLLAAVNPPILEAHLPAFARMVRILRAAL